MRHQSLSDPRGYIASFQQSDDGNRRQPLSDAMRPIGVVLRLESESTQRIARHGIEAGRYQHEVGRPVGSGRNDRGPQVSHIQLGRFAGTPRHIEDVPYPALACGTGSRIPGVLVERDIANRSIRLHQSLCAVAVMYVPIDDEHVPESGTLRIPSCHHHVIDQTESHSPGSQRMVARRTYGRKGMGSIRHDLINRREDRARGAEDRRPTVPIENGIEEKNSTTSSAHCLEGPEVGLRMNRE
jgi:hypothetical protein